MTSTGTPPAGAAPAGETAGLSGTIRNPAFFSIFSLCGAAGTPFGASGITCGAAGCTLGATTPTGENWATPQGVRNIAATIYAIDTLAAGVRR